MSSASAASLVDTPLVRSLLTIHCLTTYKEACQRGEVAIGKMLVVETNQLHGPTYVVNFPTKKQWRTSQLSYIDAGPVDLVVPMCCIALIMVAARRIRISLHSSSCPVSWRRPGHSGNLDSGARHATDAVIALARGATAAGIGRPYARPVLRLRRAPDPLPALVPRRTGPVHGDLASRTSPVLRTPAAGGRLVEAAEWAVTAATAAQDAVAHHVAVISAATSTWRCCTRCASWPRGR